MKQRLIGAAVLVALAVIFLPMLLDRPAPEPGTEAVRLDIPPPPDRDFETRELPLQPPPATGALPAPPPNAGAPIAGDTAAALGTGTLAANAGADSSTAPTASSATAEPPAAAGVEAPASRALATEPPPPASASPTAAPEPAASRPAPPPPPVRDGRYAVNLGSFGNAANAQALEAKLKAAGMPVWSESIDIDGKPAVRLRAGPFAARSDAEAARIAAQRVQSGLAATVVTLDPSAAAPAGARSGFAVQVGAFRERDDALALRDRVRGGGLAAFIDEVDTEQGRMHRVRVGPELERSRAEALRQTLRQRFQLDGLVVTHP